MTLKTYEITGALIFIVCAALAGWWWYLGDKSKATYSDFYSSMVAENTTFATAESLASQGRFAEALPLYQEALQNSTNDDQRLQLTLIIGKILVAMGSYKESLPHFKSVVLMDTDPLTARGRAAAAEEIAQLYMLGKAEL